MILEPFVINESRVGYEKWSVKQLRELIRYIIEDFRRMEMS